MTEEELTEIEEHIRKAESSPGEMYWAEEISPVIDRDVPALIAEVRRLNEQVDYERRMRDVWENRYRREQTCYRQAEESAAKLRDWQWRAVDWLHGMAIREGARVSPEVLKLLKEASDEH